MLTLSDRRSTRCNQLVSKKYLSFHVFRTLKFNVEDFSSKQTASVDREFKEVVGNILQIAVEFNCFFFQICIRSLDSLSLSFLENACVLRQQSTAAFHDTRF